MNNNITLTRGASPQAIHGRITTALHRYADIEADAIKVTSPRLHRRGPNPVRRNQ